MAAMRHAAAHYCQRYRALRQTFMSRVLQLAGSAPPNTLTSKPEHWYTQSAHAVIGIDDLARFQDIYIPTDEPPAEVRARIISSNPLIKEARMADTQHIASTHEMEKRVAKFLQHIVDDHCATSPSLWQKKAVDDPRLLLRTPGAHTYVATSSRRQI